MESADDDPVFRRYNGAGFVPIEIVLNGIIAFVCFAGICLNLCLVYVTVKTKSFHSPCNVLIGLHAFFLSFILFGYCVKFFIFLFGFNFIALRSCFYIQFVPLVGTAIAVNIQLSIGVERLSGAAFPLWYTSSGKSVMFKCALGFSFFKAILDLFIMCFACSKHWEKCYFFCILCRPVMCAFGDLLLLPENAFYTIFNGILVYCTEFICYVLIWLIIWRSKAQIPQNWRRLINSLSVIMSVGLLCYVGNSVFSLVIMPRLNVDAFANEYALVPLCVLFYVMGCGGSMPILYLCNADHFETFEHILLHHTNIGPLFEVFLDGSNKKLLSNI